MVENINDKIEKLKKEIKDFRKRETELRKEIRQVKLKRVRREKTLKVKENVRSDIIKNRIRRQVVLNFRGNEPPYFFSIRAITINPAINERGLKMTVIETARNLANKNDFDLSEFSGQYIGYETREISNNEDKQLNDLKIHIEVMFGKKIIARFIR